MSWIIESKQLVFFHNPRTAGASMIEALTAGLGAYPYSHDPEAVAWTTDHCLDVPAEMAHWRRVAFVRNPYERELSYYLWHRRFEHDEIQQMARDLSFRDWVRWRVDYLSPEELRYIHGTQSRYLLGSFARCLKYEDLPRSFEDLFGVPLGRSEATSSPAYRLRDYYDLETLELVRCYAGADFANYGYDPFRMRTW